LFILTRSKENEYDKKMCSKQQEKQHTTDQGWTRIDKKSKHKPNSKNNNNTNIDSIISSIDIELNIDKNGTLEARIDSPTRKNRCVVPDKKAYDTKTTYQAHKQEQSPVRTTTEEDGRNKTISTNISKRTTMITNYKQGEQQEKEELPEQQYDIQRGNTTKTGNNKKDKKTKETKKKTRTNSEEEVNTNILTTAVHRLKENQHNINREEDNDKNKNNDTNKKNAEGKSNKNSNNGDNNYTRVNIITPGQMATYTFTISWRPYTKVGQDGKIIIRMLMREMVHRTP
jgi:hypothetical protein